MSMHKVNFISSKIHQMTMITQCYDKNRYMVKISYWSTRKLGIESRVVTWLSTKNIKTWLEITTFMENLHKWGCRARNWMLNCMLPVSSPLLHKMLNCSFFWCPFLLFTFYALNAFKGDHEILHYYASAYCRKLLCFQLFMVFWFVMDSKLVEKANLWNKDFVNCTQIYNVWKMQERTKWKWNEVYNKNHL